MQGTRKNLICIICERIVQIPKNHKSVMSLLKNYESVILVIPAVLLLISFLGTFVRKMGKVHPRFNLNLINDTYSFPCSKRSCYKITTLMQFYNQPWLHVVQYSRSYSYNTFSRLLLQNRLGHCLNIIINNTLSFNILFNSTIFCASLSEWANNFARNCFIICYRVE